MGADGLCSSDVATSLCDDVATSLGLLPRVLPRGARNPSPNRTRAPTRIVALTLTLTLTLTHTPTRTLTLALTLTPTLTLTLALPEELPMEVATDALVPPFSMRATEEARRSP